MKMLKIIIQQSFRITVLVNILGNSGVVVKIHFGKPWRSNIILFYLKTTLINPFIKNGDE